MIQRRIDFGLSAKHYHFPSNYVSTTRYKLWTIVPLNLFEQFHRFANIWFLIVSTLQMLPFKISPTTSWATLVPLVGVLFVTFCKDAYEDLKRWRDDCRVNNQTCKVSETSEESTFKTVRWSEVQVGSFLKLQRDQPVPADLLLLFSSAGGGAFVDTAQLDGESALKPKQVVDETQHMISHNSGVEGHLEADLPNELVTKFDGCLYLKGYPRGTPVHLKNLLLRGSTVRNTAYVIGLVVYTGSDTKMVRNSSRSLTSKRSQVELLSNKLLAIIFLLLFLISIGSAIARACFIADEKGFANLSWVWPLTGGNGLQDNRYMAILTFLIGYNNLIPISLYMTTDLVRAMQACVMELDESMYDREADVACKVRSSGLCEDLGQVDFVLSDKTGTLTQNKMCFKACYVDGQVYGYWTEVPRDSEVEDPGEQSVNLLGHPSNRIERVPPHSICMPLSPVLWNVACDSDPVDDELIPLPAEGSTVQNFFLCLATCHEAVPERKGSTGQNAARTTNTIVDIQYDLDYALQHDPGMVNLHLESDIQQRQRLVEEAQNTVFRSPSPDEEALLAMARDFGFFFQKKEGNQITINVRGEEIVFTVLLVNEFSSERKRMSVLVHRANESYDPDLLAKPAAALSSMEGLQLEAGQFLLFAKGADSVMMERITSGRGGGQRLPSENDFVPDKRGLGASDGQQSSGLLNFRGGPGEMPKPVPVAPKEPAPLLQLPDLAAAHATVKSRSLSIFSSENSASHAGMVSWTGKAFMGHSESIASMPAVVELKQQKKLKFARDHLRHFSHHGLRTLVCGYRELSDTEARRFVKEHGIAKTSLFNREEKVSQVVDEMERGFSLLGVTAVEDKIQVGVPETVKMLLDGGIRVWMLTGDSVETAVNIAGVCRLVPPQCKLFYLTFEADKTKDDPKDELAGKLRKILDTITESEADGSKGLTFSLVINGTALYAILDEGSASTASMKRLFATVACNSCSVIACRLAPAQKAALVELLQKGIPGNPLTLAVGDGGNDVSMIQKAHVGVGIYGAEGREAVNASDFAIGQFRFLRSLLFLHGRSNIRRIGIVIGYSFYKNFLLVICMACYAPWNGLSGTTFYDSYLIMMYNMVFTSIPIFIVGSLDMDIYAPGAFALPKLYLFGVNKVYFNYRMLVAWLFGGIVHALVNFCAAVFLLGGLLGNGDHFPDYLSLGTWSYWSCVVVANSTLLLHSQVWMDWQIFIAMLSVMLFPPILFIYSSPAASNLFNPSFHDVAFNLFQSLPGWLCLVLVLALSVLVELAMDSWRRVKRPDMITRVQEVQGKKSDKVKKIAPQQPSASKMAGPIDSLGLQTEPDKTIPSNLGSSPSFFSAPAIAPMTIKSPVSPSTLSPSAAVLNPFSTNQFTRTGLDMVQKIERLQQLYPATLVSSLPWSYKQDSYDVEEYRAEAALLRAHAGNAWHPPVKQPGLRLLYEALWWLQGEGPADGAGALQTLKDLSYGRLSLAARWRARLNHLQWCQIVLMFDDLDKETPVEAAKSQASDDVASKLSKKTGMQKELLHLDHLASLTREQSFRLSTWGPKEAPTRASNTRRYTTDFEYNIINLQFRSNFHEEAFRRYFDEGSRKHFFVSVRAVTWVIVVGFQVAKLVALVATPLREGKEPGEKTQEILQTCLVIVASIVGYQIVLLPLRIEGFKAVQPYVATAACILILGKHVYETITRLHGEVSDAIMPLFLVAGVRMRFPVMILVLCLHMLVLLVYNTFLLSEDSCVTGSGEAKVSVCDSNNILRGEYSVIQFNVVLIVVVYTYVSERFARFNFAWGDMISSARSSDRDILKGMYPEDVVEAVRTSFLKNQGAAEANTSVSSTETIFQDRGIVTVVFIDIYDFGKVVAGLHPCDLVMMLDRVFSLMDKVCQEHGVVKIETVGKTFMFAGLGEEGCKEAALQVQAVKCLETAWAILQQFTRSSLGLDGRLHIEKLHLKIGINTGNVISGVVGSQKPQFALFGDTINTASRMMSTGEVDRIHVSSETYELVRHQRSFYWHQQEIFAKGKGMMTTYLLEKGTPTMAETLAVPRQLDAGDGSQDADGNPQTKKHFGFSLGCPSWPTKSREMLRTHWSFCCKVYARDSRKTSNGKGLFASLLLFWVCFCMQSCFIITGATGLAADDLDLVLQLRGGFALASAILLLGGLVLFRHRAQTTSDTEPVRYLDSVRPHGSDDSGVAARESDGSAVTLSRDSEGEQRDQDLTEAPEANTGATDEIQSVRDAGGDGLRWLSQFLYTGFPVCLVLAGYVTALVSNIQGIAGGEAPKIAYWLYYESIFYSSALMYLNAFRVSLASLICSVFMLFPATIGGIRADWPGGAIYPLTVLILHLKVVTDLKRYQLQGLEDLKMVEKEHAECESLLNSLLPKEVLLSMQSNTLELAYTYRNMSMLFADIVGFTGYCNKHKDNPSDAVRLVTHLFASFDDCCKLLGAYKVCTIGDAYLAVNEPKTQHDESVTGALVLLHLAMAMLRIIVKVRDEVQHEGLNMRIGLHHGEFVAGVIGSNQLRFDIWGEDVLMGNQMESDGEPGRICCSATFVEVLKDFKDFSFSSHDPPRVIKCAGSNRTLESFLLDAPHGTGQGRIESPRSAQRGKSFRQVSPRTPRRGTSS